MHVFYGVNEVTYRYMYFTSPPANSVFDVGCTLQKRDGYFNLAKVISVAALEIEAE